MRSGPLRGPNRNAVSSQRGAPMNAPSGLSIASKEIVLCGFAGDRLDGLGYLRAQIFGAGVYRAIVL